MQPEERFPKMRKVKSIGTFPHPPIGIQCLGCGKATFNENDIREVYCANCHKFGSLLDVT